MLENWKTEGSNTPEQLEEVDEVIRKIKDQVKFFKYKNTGTNQDRFNKAYGQYYIPPGKTEKDCFGKCPMRPEVIQKEFDIFSRLWFLQLLLQKLKIKGTEKAALGSIKIECPWGDLSGCCWADINTKCYNDSIKKDADKEAAI